jgi:Fe-S-cluster-containing dehydrogenase component
MTHHLLLNRRRFLKATGAAALIGAAEVTTVPKKAQAGQGNLATLIDLTRCDGCEGLPVPACVAACKTIKAGALPEPVSPIPVPFPKPVVEDWSKRREVADRLTPYNRITVQKAVVREGGRQTAVFIPRRCMHCDNPACATLCPFAANHKYENGAVVIDPDICFGGAKCKAVCPWEIPQRQSGIGVYLKILPTLMGNGVMVKCDLCNDLLREGKTPACIAACPRQAMAIGPRAEILARAEALARRIGGHLYGKNENGGTGTFYVSPVPFADLDTAIGKGPGRPGLAPAVRKMAASDGLGKAVLAAPAIGIVAGLAGVFKALARRKEKAGREERQ